MNTEVGKANGKGKPVVKKTPAKPAEKPEKISGWSIARTMLAAGAKDEAIKKAVTDHVLKTLDAREALKMWSARVAARALFRAKKTAKIVKAGKGK